MALCTPDPVSDKLAYNVEEAYRALGCGRTKLFALIAAGELKARKIRTRTVIPTECLREFVARLPEAA